MSRSFPADISRQKAMEERYNKEASAQFAFYLKKKNEGKGDEMTASRQMEVLKKKIEMAPKVSAELLQVAEKLQKEGKHSKPKTDPDDELLERIKRTEGGKTMEEMRPPSCKTKSLLYDGFSKEGKGKVQYLNARTDKSPEEKYVYPILNSMEYGWKLGEVIKIEDVKKPVNGRTRLINDTFYTRTGVPVKHMEGMLVTENRL